MALMARLLEFGPEISSGDDKLDLARALCYFKLSLSDGVPAAVIPGRLYLGSMGSAYNEAGLKEAGITHILSLCASARLRFPGSFLYKRVALSDDGSEESTALLQERMEECLDFIDEARVCFVHCAQGKSRSAAVAIAYLIRRHDDRPSYQEALDRVRITRPIAEPNPSFSRLLQSLPHSTHS